VDGGVIISGLNARWISSRLRTPHCQRLMANQKIGIRFRIE